jgi:hypothetical protein
MSNSFERDVVGAQAAPSVNIGTITAMGTALVAVNIVLMLVLSYTPVAAIGRMLFSSFFIGIATFVITVGGGFWLSNTGIEKGNYPLAGVGITLIQAGYGLFGAAILTSFASEGLWIPALAITTVITAGITAVVALVVFKTDHSFANWQKYSWGFFIGGFAVGAIGFFVMPLLMLVAGLLFFLGFVVDLTYEIWAVKANRYASDLRNALGIYVAVMGVFVHVLQLVLRILSILDN